MKKVFKPIIVLCTYIVALSPLSAEILLSWDFDLIGNDNREAVPSTYQATHIKQASLNSNGPIIPINRTYSSAYRSVTEASSIEQAIEKHSYIEFNVSAEDGFAFKIESFQLRIHDVASTKGAPYFSVRTSIDNFSEASDIFKIHKGNVKVPLHTFTTQHFPSLSSLTFRIYVFDESGTGNAYNTYLGLGNVAFKDGKPDLTIEGTVIPLEKETSDTSL